MDSAQEHALQVTRRYFFKECGVGVGKIALASLLADTFGRRAAAASQRRANPLAAMAPPFAPRAKHVIHLVLAGAPSSLDLLDYKPSLAKLEGRSIPDEIVRGQRYAFIRADAAALGPRFKFARHGRCGAELSEVLPHLATVVDDLCFI